MFRISSTGIPGFASMITSGSWNNSLYCGTRSLTLSLRFLKVLHPCFRLRYVRRSSVGIMIPPMLVRAMPTVCLAARKDMSFSMKDGGGPSASSWPKKSATRCHSRRAAAFFPTYARLTSSKLNSCNAFHKAGVIVGTTVLHSRKVKQHMLRRQGQKRYPMFELITQAEHLMLI
jgi:hypothetical protein